uniref:Uncharacterized protein n=1 Tax=viral metagenome TaxID=1070528 RepID=A0A6M3J3V1_9ZZZZ
MKAAYERKAKPKRLVKQAKVKPAEKTKYVRPLPAPITRHWSEEPDRDAKMRNLDRGTRKGFKWYWEMNPIHFDHLFPGLPVGIGDGK